MQNPNAMSAEYTMAIQKKAQKQDFLKAEIIDKGYSKEEFAVFLEQQKEGGNDVDSWSFPELQDIVQKFQKKFPLDTQKKKIVRKLTEDGEMVPVDAAELKRMETGNIFDDLKEENIRQARGSIAIRSGEYERDTRKLVDSLVNKTKGISITLG